MLRSAQVRADLPRKSWSVPVFGLMLGFVQLRAGFAKNTVLLVPGQNARSASSLQSEISLVDARARAKPCYASARHAWVRAGPRRICRENRAPC